MRLGIDFGTSNTSAAVFDGKKLTYIPLDPLNSSAHNLRSMIYVDRKQRVKLGVEAIQSFLRDDTGRETIFEDKVVGTIENTVARQERGVSDADEAITIIYDVVISDDVAMRGRLLQSIKTALRSPSYDGTQIFDRYYTTEELIALILRRVKERAEAYLEQSCTQAVIGRPVTFSHNVDTDRIAVERIHRAAELAGLSDITMATEPVAAATYYATNSQRAETVLVFDFGGGTLDLTLLQTTENGRMANGQQTILASIGALVGGDDIDTAMMRGKVAPWFGTTSNIDFNFDGCPVPFPESLAEYLDQWQTIPLLTRPQPLSIIQRGIQYGDNRQAFAALETLATKNYGFALFQAIERAKCELSQQTQSKIQLQMEKIDLDIELSRTEFNTLISQEKSEVRQAIREVIAASGIKAEQVDVIVATGGSSSIPAFQTLLKTELPRAKLLVSNVFGSTTGGLAIIAHQLQQG